MTIPELSKDHEYEEKGEDFCDIGESDPEYGSDDSTKDPSYSDLEETHAKFTELSIKKKSKARIVKDIDLGSEEDLDGEEMVVLVPQLNEKDEKSFEMVQKIIEGRQIEKLKVEQCKLYLRKNGLRLTGNKDTLIQRIKEHLEILNGGGEKRYPASSFVLNCKGDACTGDVVMFEQNVYEMFDIASRSARGPPCGRRIVAGHIVKESYGAAKQQHTFTIEVLWSKGEKPLPPLHPLLIKGRNLYQLKTLRQRWEDEGERQKALMEKHSRGSLARSERETRIQEKEKRKILKTNRVSRKEEPKKNQSRFNSTSTLKSSVQPQQSGSEFNSEIPANRHQPFGTSVDSGNTKMGPPKLGSFTDSVKPATQTHQSKIAVNSQKPATIAPASKSCFMQDRYFNKASQNLDESRNSNNTERVYLKSNTYDSMPIDTIKLPLPLFNGIKGLSQKSYQRQPLTSVNHFLPMSTRGQKQICRYYAQGRCYYGDNCKFSHEIRGDYNERREDRWPRAAAEHRRD